MNFTTNAKILLVFLWKPSQLRRKMSKLVQLLKSHILYFMGLTPYLFPTSFSFFTFFGTDVVKTFTPFFLCLYGAFSQHLSRLDSNHRHLSDIDCSMACTACLVCFISTVNGCSKKRSLLRWALLAGT